MPRMTPSMEKMNSFFTREIRDCLDVFGTPKAVKTRLSLTWIDRVQYQTEMRKISRLRPPSVDDEELGRSLFILN